ATFPWLRCAGYAGTGIAGIRSQACFCIDPHRVAAYLRDAIPTALFRGDHLFSAKSSGELVCVESRTGKQVWESDKVTYLKNGASIHLTPNGDSVLLYTDRGELIRAQLTSAGYKEISRVAVLAPTFPFAGRNVAWSPPAYANRHIFARNSKELICASLAKP